MFWGMNKNLAYLADSHTYSACRVQLVIAKVLIPHGEFL